MYPEQTQSVPAWLRVAEAPSGRNLIMLAVVAAHASMLWWLVAARSLMPALVEPPALAGVLVSLPTEAVKPHTPPVPVVKPKSQVKPQPASIPVPKAASSERSVTAPAQVPTPVATHAEVPPESSRPAAPAVVPPVLAEPAPPPVVPPRSDASYLNNPEPPYPIMARRMQQQGRVLLDVYILPSGTVGDLKIKRSSGYPLLDESASESVRRWRFVPARRGGEAIAYWYTVPVDFSLDR